MDLVQEGERYEGIPMHRYYHSEINVPDVSAATASSIISRPIRRRPNYAIYFH